MVMADALGTILAPTAGLMPTTTIEVCSVLWALLMHPGSTHTSNLISLHRDLSDVIEDAVNTDRAVCKGPWKRQQQGRASDSRTHLLGT